MTVVRTPKAIGTRIRSARKARGLTQQQLAERAHLTRQTLGRIEDGKHTAEIGKVVSVLTALGLSISIVDTPEDDGIDLSHITRR